jgi:hypothetical protein
MLFDVAEIVSPAVLQPVRSRPCEQGLVDAGSGLPRAAGPLLQNARALLLDVRCATGTAQTRNPRFVRGLASRWAKVGGKNAIPQR